MKNSRTLGSGRVALGLAAALVLGGVWLATCCTPSPPQPANAVLIDGTFPPKVRPGTGDVKLLTCCRGAERFSRSRSGKFYHDLHLVTFAVLRVEKGAWPDQTLAFVVDDYWPTPESGLMVDKAPLPYQRGWYYGFELDSSRRPAVIAASEERSCLPPHGQPDYLFDNRGGAEDQRMLRQRIDSAVSAYEKAHGLETGGGWSYSYEQTPDAYVVAKGSLGKEAVLRIFLINRKSLEVELLDPSKTPISR